MCAQSAVRREALQLVDRLEQPEAGSSPLAFESPFPQPLWRQYLIILVKNLVSVLVAERPAGPPELNDMIIALSLKTNGDK